MTAKKFNCRHQIFRSSHPANDLLDMKRSCLLLVCAAVCSAAVNASADLLLRPKDPLAPRDEWGPLHQSPSLKAADFEKRRFYTRLTYYMQSGRSLMSDPAYVGAVQTALRRLGYYCGEADGVFTPEVSLAIARLQKNHSMKVTGNLTIPVRRALRLP